MRYIRGNVHHGHLSVNDYGWTEYTKLFIIYCPQQLLSRIILVVNNWFQHHSFMSTWWLVSLSGFAHLFSSVELYLSHFMIARKLSQYEFYWNGSATFIDIALTWVVDHIERMIVGMVMLVDWVIRAFVDCCDDGIATHIAVILVTGVPQITVKEEHIPGFHLDWHQLIPL